MATAGPAFAPCKGWEQFKYRSPANLTNLLVALRQVSVRELGPPLHRHKLAGFPVLHTS